MSYDFVKSLWHKLGRAQHTLGKGRGKLPVVERMLREVLVDSTELMRLRSVPMPEAVPDGNRPPDLSAGFVGEVITEAQIALAAGDLRKFVHQIHRSIAMVEAMQKRGGIL
jgi:hypothetical protein